MAGSGEVPPLTASTALPELVADPETLAAYADDFGHAISRRPSAVAFPKSVDEVVTVMLHARDSGTPVVARGLGHSMGGDSQVAGGIVIDTTELDHIGDPAGGSVWVQAGATWEALLEATYAARLAPLVVPHYPRLSIGGVLSLGGVGLTSFRHCFATDTVLELEVVTGQGELVRCSDASDSELFDAALGGLGQFGVIVGARIRVESAPERLIDVRLFYDDYDAYFDALSRAASIPDVVGLLGTVNPSANGRADCTLHAQVPGDRDAAAAVAAVAEQLPPATRELEPLEIPYLDFCGLVMQMAELWRQTSDYLERFHPILSVFLSPGGAARFLDAHLDSIFHSEDRGRLGDAAVYVIGGPRRDRATPRLPDGDPVVAFSDNCGFPADPETIAWAAQRNRRLYREARALGGTLYPLGFPPPSPEEWREHFGPRWNDLVAAKRRYDPDGVLARDLSR